VGHGMDQAEAQLERADGLELRADRTRRSGHGAARRTWRSLQAKSDRHARDACRDMAAYARRGLTDPA
jgi:hypothetical protein